jgi:phenylpropionate dioxygenase-like ring-hydroxylating dioxygenase large terminal subunit
MLTTRQKTLRRFWYATLPLHDLADGPKPFKLMGEDIVLFIDENGEPAALKDRCLHRTAKLSTGWCEKGFLVCGYHGWTYNRDGSLMTIPQRSEQRTSLGGWKVQSHHCQGRYGYAWVALDDPLLPLFDIPEDNDPAFRRIFQFHSVWNTAPLRLMENSFDNAHFSFVHRNTFGIQSSPRPQRYEITETDYGFRATSTVEIANPPEAHAVTGTTAPTTTREMNNHWYMPFCRRLDMTYPGGLRHIIINSATPVADDRIVLVQLLYRNDTEADCPTRTLIDWDAKITEEDRQVLESTDCDAALDLSRGAEGSMPSDRPGMIMRERLLRLLHEQGEEEVRRS